MTNFLVGIENLAAVLVLVVAAAAVLGGFWALVDTCVSYAAARFDQRPSPAADTTRRAELGFATKVVPFRKEIL